MHARMQRRSTRMKPPTLAEKGTPSSSSQAASFVQEKQKEFEVAARDEITTFTTNSPLSEDYVLYLQNTQAARMLGGRIKSGLNLTTTQWDNVEKNALLFPIDILPPVYAVQLLRTYVVLDKDASNTLSRREVESTAVLFCPLVPWTTDSTGRVDHGSNVLYLFDISGLFVLSFTDYACFCSKISACSEPLHRSSLLQYHEEERRLVSHDGGSSGAVRLSEAESSNSFLEVKFVLGSLLVAYKFYELAQALLAALHTVHTVVHTAHAAGHAAHAYVHFPHPPSKGLKTACEKLVKVVHQMRDAVDGTTIHTIVHETQYMFKKLDSWAGIKHVVEKIFSLLDIKAQAQSRQNIEASIGNMEHDIKEAEEIYNHYLHLHQHGKHMNSGKEKEALKKWITHLTGYEWTGKGKTTGLAQRKN
ncbi:unnamed protein product [Amoebophrya sp. A120]|nr:unnamed protein product [Amoebophrya sp. A120]|eukprot:GSA120T00001895001.1